MVNLLRTRGKKRMYIVLPHIIQNYDSVVDSVIPGILLLTFLRTILESLTPSMGNNLSKMKPTEQELTNRLRYLVYWEEFAINLPGIQRADILLIKGEPTNVTLGNIKQALYDKWLQSCTTANWGDVIQALMAIEQNAIANTILQQLVSSCQE